MGLLRRLRGIAGTALTWACAWGLAGAAAYAIATLTWDLAPGASRSGMILTGTAFLAAYGFLAGGVFAVVLSLAERRRTLARLTLPRVAAWGALGSAVMAAAAVAPLGLTPVNGLLLGLGILLGSGCAASSLALARRGLPAGPRPIPGHPPETALPERGS